MMEVKIKVNQKINVEHLFLWERVVREMGLEQLSKLVDKYVLIIEPISFKYVV